MTQTTKKQRTPAARAKTAAIRNAPVELDSVYVLKLVMYLILGTLWIHLSNPANTTHIPIPIGLIVGIMFAMHDHFKIDRKVEYALLLAAMLIGFWTQAGIFIVW